MTNFVDMTKKEIRKQALERRNSLSEADSASLSQRLLDRLKTFDFSNIKAIHFFLPIVAKREPDTFLMIDWLQGVHPEIEIIVSKADFETSVMNHYTYAGKNDLINNHYHIPEPQMAKATTTKPDMVIVPLLAFDNKGFRVGYGKGFYDRFLQNLETLKVGLSFFDAGEYIEDANEYDIQLDQCITPNKIITFKKD